MAARNASQNTSDWVGGRWQAPLVIVALATAALALYRFKPPERHVAFDSVLADVRALIEARHYGDAADALANLLQAAPPPAPAEQAILHSLMTDVIYRQELRRSVPNLQNVALLLEHHERLVSLGGQLDARALLRAGQAHEWLGDVRSAIEAYRSTLSRTPGDDTRRQALQALVRLMEGRPQYAEERRQRIEESLAEAGVAPPHSWWAIQHAMQEAFDQNDLARARHILERYGERFQRSDLQGYHHYLWGWLLVQEGRNDEARPRCEWVDEWLRSHEHADTEMDRVGFLPALNRWLAGRIDLADARPQSALEHFEATLKLQRSGGLAARAEAGRAEALAMLEQHELARRELREAARRILERETDDSPILACFRDGLSRLHERLEAAGDFEQAVQYLAMALDFTPDDEQDVRLVLLERLGNAHNRVAAAELDETRRRAHFAAAGQCLEQAAAGAREPAHAAALLWDGAQAYDGAGRLPGARRMLAAFAQTASNDPRLPPALLQLGQAYAADGLFEQAVTVYSRLIAEYPPLDEALRARLLLADCWVSIGPEHFPRAEQMLLDLLESGKLAPSAAVYRDALSQLCDLYFDEQRYAETISRAEDYLTFYPQDAERHRIRFLLADAYRRSAQALRAQPPAGAPPERADDESRRRFARAAALFGELAGELGGEAPEAADARAYERWALLHRGDCLLELNDAPSLDEALNAFRQAAARFQAEPTALTAQVQIANVHLRQGRLTEAARAIERARWLLQTMPDAAFAAAPGGCDRAHWDRFLGTVVESQLLRDVFKDAP